MISFVKIVLALVFVSATLLYFLSSFVLVPQLHSAPLRHSRVLLQETQTLSPWDQWSNMSVVILWVNGSDPNYRKLRARYSGKSIASEAGGSRDRDSGELIHALRSLEKFMPWHKGQIFLVTPGQTPPWINNNHPRLKIINQDDLLPDLGTVLPTFNSLVVEFFLHKIPGLTDVFLYMNDDMFFGQPVEPWHFFTNDGAPKIYFEDYIFQYDPNIPVTKGWLRMLSKTHHLLDQRYGEAERFRLKHVPIVYYRPLALRIHEIWQREIYEMLPYRFRDPSNVIFTFFHEYMLVHEGSECCGLKWSLPTPEEIDNAKLYSVTNDDEAMKAIYNEILANPPRFFTMNDVFSKQTSGFLLDSFLDTMFPEPSSFEL